MDITGQPQQRPSRPEADEEDDGHSVGKSVKTLNVGKRAIERAIPTPGGSVWGPYQLLGKIDQGTFSTVKLATLISEQHLAPDRRRQFAIKMITPTSHPLRIEREIRCMLKIGGQCNVVGIVDGYRDEVSTGLVMNYIPHETFQQYYASLTPAELQRYMQQLLIALERVHLHGVIHRDVKPSNFLHSRSNGGTYMLVDFGLAQETRSGELSLDVPGARASCSCYGRPQVCNGCLVKREMNAPRAGTAGYRPPEVLMKHQDQTTAVDIWAAGVIFLSMLAKFSSFFGNEDDSKSLAYIITVFGYERLAETARALNRMLMVGEGDMMHLRPLSLRRICQHFRSLYRQRGETVEPEIDRGSGGSSPPSVPGDDQSYGCGNCCKPPEKCLCEEQQSGTGAGTVCDDEYGPEAYDLLEKLLETNPYKRITAAEALKHPYFQVQY